MLAHWIIETASDDRYTMFSWLWYAAIVGLIVAVLMPFFTEPPTPPRKRVRRSVDQLNRE